MENYFDKLKKLSKNAYVPYSQFHVSTICRLKDGTEINGVNVENAAFPVTICAERTSIAQVYTLGYNKKDIEKIFLYTDSHQQGSPCGMCRQFLWELVEHDTMLQIFNNIGDSYELRIGDLLPYGFTEKDLK